MTRSELRENIFNMLFQVEFNPEEERIEQMDLYVDGLGEIKDKDKVYIETKYQNIISHLEEIDSFLNSETDGWKTNRMNKVDLTILRLAVYELKWDDDVPTGVAINEAVELAKKYSSDDGPAFINGVLAKFA